MSIFFSIFSRRCFVALFATFCWSALNGSSTSQQRYLELVEKFPRLVTPTGDAAKGEIQILLDKEKMDEIEKATGRQVGVLQEDAYWIWVNDACLFPNGKQGVYGRILWKRSLDSEGAVAVMPILPDGRIVLNCNYRHATRSWEIELPKGLVDQGESAEAAAQREAKEETGMVIDKPILLGSMPTDSGAMSLCLPIYAAPVLSQGNQQTEDSEAIEKTLALSFSEILDAFKKGFISVWIRGEEKKIPMRDPCLSFALTLYTPNETR